MDIQIHKEQQKEKIADALLSIVSIIIPFLFFGLGLLALEFVAAMADNAIVPFGAVFLTLFVFGLHTFFIKEHERKRRWQRTIIWFCILFFFVMIFSGRIW